MKHSEYSQHSYHDHAWGSNERRLLFSFSGAQGGDFQIKTPSPSLFMGGVWHSLERESLINQIHSCSVD